MDPQACTAIILKQADPFYISDTIIQNEQDITMNVLSTIFGHGMFNQLLCDPIS